MNEAIVRLETGYFNYPNVEVVYEGTNIEKYYDNSFLYQFVLDAVIDASEDNDMYDFAALVFTGINQSVKRRATGQELMLKSVEVFGEDYLSVKICR